MASDDFKYPVNCSFCCKNQGEVDKMIYAGHSRIYICSECVEICAAIVTGNPEPFKQQPKQPAQGNGDDGL